MIMAGKLLIADDESTFCQATAALLRRENFKCICAHDGVEAQELLARQPFDLVIADINMRGNDGLQLVHHLAQHPTPLPVILVTGYPTTQTAMNAVGHNVVAYLVKPVPFPELLTHVHEAVRRTSLARVVQSSQQRLRSSLIAMDQLEALLHTPSATQPTAALNTYLGLTLHNAFTALLEVKQLFESLAANAPAGITPPPKELAETSALVHTLTDTLATLEKVQASLHNDELQAIRDRLARPTPPSS